MTPEARGARDDRERAAARALAETVLGSEQGVPAAAIEPVTSESVLDA